MLKRNLFFDEFIHIKNDYQKQKATAESTSVSLETPLAENIQVENLVAGPRKNQRIHPENLDEIKSSLRKEIMSDLTKILAENQKEMLKVIAPTNKKPVSSQNLENFDSEIENVFPTNTLTAIGPKTTTTQTTKPR